MKNVNSPRYNGFCPNKVIGIAPATGDKGVVLSYKTAKYQVFRFFKYKCGELCFLLNIKNLFMHQMIFNSNLNFQNKPAKCIVKTTIKAGPRRALNSVSRFVRFNKYRKDLKMVSNY